ncbi:MAG: tRNA (cytidine(34)-2'-O)-methyltransferase [Bdellovibrionaceae bacterium]|nr:tRNA (cytidine(34)-2'-O)-methyltransferase [Pseudobdellovibrionaceae bacterium]
MYPKTNFNIVLVEPEIPQNTGNIGRTCVGTWSKLHLVGPLGFNIEDKQLKRAGLDYWPELSWQYYQNRSSWLKTVPDPQRAFLFTTKASKSFYDIELQEGDWFVFGKETKGLDKKWLEENWGQAVTLPFPGKVRSFNLSNCVAMVLGEGLRQLSQRSTF